MFDMDNLPVLVGKQASDPVIQAFLRCAQLPDPPKINRADSNVYLDKEAEGGVRFLKTLISRLWKAMTCSQSFKERC
ncbi:hypothetical protein [Burkholderia ubonensis]|uniref:hypothetical protein n=1 Tax=Burkholderia ubonensis TaxID=101571 RepID=UPI000AEC03B0|nr:hypothetical protein [Burkholderia ubonensis]